MTPHIPRRYVTDHNGQLIVRGWPNIAAVLGRHKTTVMAYSRRVEDPLPTRQERISKRVWIDLDALIAWGSRNSIFDAP